MIYYSLSSVLPLTGELEGVFYFNTFFPLIMLIPFCILLMR